MRKQARFFEIMTTVMFVMAVLVAAASIYGAHGDPWRIVHSVAIIMITASVYVSSRVVSKILASLVLASFGENHDRDKAFAKLRYQLAMLSMMAMVLGTFALERL